MAGIYLYDDAAPGELDGCADAHSGSEDALQALHAANEELTERLLGAEQELATARGENAHLRSQLEAARALVTNLQMHVLLGESSHTPTPSERSGCDSDAEADDARDSVAAAAVSVAATRRRVKLSNDMLQRWEFYRCHKEDPDIVTPLRERLQAIGIDRVPWQLIKAACDAQYKLARPKTEADTSTATAATTDA